VLSQEEVARLIDAAESTFHRILLMTLYATGARRAKAAHLKIGDTDSQRMVVHIRGGKGGLDRDVMLSPKPNQRAIASVHYMDMSALQATGQPDVLSVPSISLPMHLLQ
jgi:site-specific recombinase XerD